MEKLVDAIKEGEIIRMPESLARAEDLFILRSIEDIGTQFESIIQAKKQAEKIKEYKKPSFFDSWKRGEDYKKNNVINELIPNFHWDIIRGRKSKGLTRLQFSSRIGISEEDLKMIELGRLPSDDFVYINKIENYLKINLRKNSAKPVSLADLQKKADDAKQKDVKDVKKDNKNAILGSGIELSD